MKKFAAGAGAAVVTVAGLSGLTMAPAAAYDTCAEVYAAGKSHLTANDFGYTPGLDGSDNDGIGCEAPPWGDAPSVPTPQTPQAPEVSTPEAPQAPVATDPAAQEPWAWDNCSEAYANGVSNIPAGAPGYGTHLDSDLDGIGCELDGSDAAAFPTPVGDDADDDESSSAAAETEASQAAEAAQGSEASQVTEVPTGAAETGVPVKDSSSQAGLIGLSVLALGAVAGSGLLVRRVVKA